MTVAHKTASQPSHPPIEPLRHRHERSGRASLADTVICMAVTDHRFAATERVEVRKMAEYSTWEEFRSDLLAFDLPDADPESLERTKTHLRPAALVQCRVRCRGDLIRLHWLGGEAFHWEGLCAREIARTLVA